MPNVRVLTSGFTGKEESIPCEVTCQLSDGCIYDWCGPDGDCPRDFCVDYGCQECVGQVNNPK